MTIRTSDGIDIYCLPDCAKCKYTGELVEDMDECPVNDSGVCIPDYCYWYVEDWNNEYGKEDL